MKGPLEARFEKIYWKTWDTNFRIEFDFKLLKLHPEENPQGYNHQHCRDFVKIETLIEDEPNKIYTKISYCEGYHSDPQNLTFEQMTQNGLKKVVLKMDKVGETLHFFAFSNWAGMEFGLGPREWYPTIDHGKYNNAISKKKNKFTVSGINSEYVEISNLEIRKNVA